MKKFFLSLLFCCFFISTYGEALSMQKVIIMLGAPGSGKGTQAVQLAKSFDLPHISTGDLFRENLKKQTALGLQVKQYMDQGQLVPDQLVLDMLFAYLQSIHSTKGYILDGFPRTVTQAEALQSQLPHDACLIVISLEVPDEEIVKRISGRRVCAQCGAPYHLSNNPPQVEGTCDRCGGALLQRNDDTEEVVRERLRIYHEQENSLKNFYQAHAYLFLVDGTQTPQAIQKELQEKVHAACPEDQ